MAVQVNVAKLVIGDNSYIDDKKVTVYWCDGTDLKVLETEIPDMSNVITTLGTATGGGNAITDISIDGNILTPAKNKNFVDTDYDQSISGQKTFNTTIHSVGIMIQTYDNLSVVCAGGGDDALLLLKADKTKLIDSYTKGETDNLLISKTNNGVSQTKGEDDALLLLKAVKTQLIDSYTKSKDDALLFLKDDKTQMIDSQTKGETNNLLNNKADTGVSYTKGEDDALILLKADKAQLIDSYSKSETYARDEVYTKGETNNLLNNKADNGISYTKGEDDTLLFAKADKTQLIDSFTKGEADNLLNSKAIQSTTYIKTETDYVISQIDVGDVDLADYYSKTKTNELLVEKVDTIELSNYVTLGTQQTINANKTFNNACRFTSTLDRMSTVTGASFVKLGADNTVVLLGADDDVQDIQGIIRKTTLDQSYPEQTDDDYITLGAVKSEFVSSIYSGSISGNLTATQFIKSGGTNQQVLLANGTTKSLSQFARGSVDDSTYVKKTGQELQIIHEILRRDDDELSMSEYNKDYLTRGEIYNVFISLYDNQMIYGTKTFNSNTNAAEFTKPGKDDTSVLLAGGGDQLLSSFGGAQVEDITNLILNLHSNITFNCLKLVRIGTFYTLMMEITPKTQISIQTGTVICSIGTSSTGISPPTHPSTSYPIQLATKRKTLTCVHSYRDIRITTDSTEAWGVNDDVGLQFSWML
ncbi:MAG: hypothetical protein EZS28_007523 [Streblomastix strix]|uniref:Uncharacterized protein n=1 Tax=Streblomastix strix TaxID=222440 RepID=A0A5J4WPB0_9EUKA|nr:MAG: hypothetical protein EZS28_007523 [Streblomastix strix]